jgi:hypothetical protein
MRKITTITLAVLAFTMHLSAQAVDMGSIVKAQIILGQVTQIMEKYQEVQALLDQGVIELDVPEPEEDNSGKFLFPYTYDGELTPWAEKALNAQVGAEVGAMAAEEGGKVLVSKVPFGGLLMGGLKSKAKETGAVMAVGGWEFIRENSEISFKKLTDLSVYMHVEFEGDVDYESALAAATAIYPKLEKGHKRAVDKAYKDAKKKAAKYKKEQKAAAKAAAADY